MLLKLYCNLRIIPFAFAPKDRSFPIFRVAHARTLAEAGLAGGFGDVDLRPGERLSTRPKEVCDVIHGAAGRNRTRARSEARGGELRRGAAVCRWVGTLVFVFVAVMAVAAFGAGRPAETTALGLRRDVGRAGELRARRGAAQVFDQARWDLLKEARRDGRVRHVGAVAAAVAGAGDDQRVHGAGHPAGAAARARLEGA